MRKQFAIYRKELPLPIRRAVGWARRKILPHPVWDSEEFQHYYGWLQESQWKSREQLEAEQQNQLARLIKHAYENVPYYRRVFKERKLKPADVQALEDLEKIPLLTKEAIRENLEDLVARNIDRSKLQFKTTSGSTGNPLGLYDEGFKSHIHEAAFRYRQWSWAGYRFGDRVLNLRSFVTRIDRIGERAGWDFNVADNQLMVSPASLNDERLQQYVRLIRAFEPQFIEATPSCLEIMALFLIKNAISLPEIKAIFCESENLYEIQRQRIEEQFRCKIFSGYGHSERCVDAVECEKHQGYDVSMEYGLFELVDERGESIHSSGKPGRVVGTGFDNYPMPLIRYLTDDLAVFGPGLCSCGREYVKLEELKGRISEYVVLRAGNLIPLSAIYSSIHSKVLFDIRQLRFYQEQEGKLAVQVVIAPGAQPELVKLVLLDELHNKVDPKDLSIEVRFLESLPLKTSRKAGLLFQKLPIPFVNIS